MKCFFEYVVKWTMVCFICGSKRVSFCFIENAITALFANSMDSAALELLPLRNNDTLTGFGCSPKDEFASAILS